MNTIFSRIVSKLLSYVSPIIRIYERKLIKKYGRMPLKHQPIFIIGAPRTGSTILYQILTNQYDVLYIDNLVCRLYKNIFFGFLLSNKWFKNKAHNCFNSEHGDTSRHGLHSPSECGKFWYRWLPFDKHFIDYNEINENTVEQIREEITSVINYFDKPIIFKNLNAGQRLRLIFKCFPDAKLIFIRREPIFTVQSILKAKRKLGLKDNIFWSIKPFNFEKLKNYDAYEQIVKQVYFLEKQISIDKNLFNQKGFLSLFYQELNEDLENVLNRCSSIMQANEKTTFYKAKIDVQEKISLLQDEVQKFEEQISKLDWKEYNDK